MKVMVTGHRPNKLGGYPKGNWVSKFDLLPFKQQKVAYKMNEIASELKERYEKVIFISGMAQGVDQLWTHIAQINEIDVHAYIPFKGQEKHWPLESQRIYSDLLSRCTSVEYGSEKEELSYQEVVKLLLKRNSDMIKESDLAYSFWDGSKGGTFDATQKCKKANIELTIVNPNTL